MKTNLSKMFKPFWKTSNIYTSKLGSGNIVAYLTSMPYYASMNTSIQCLFTFDCMYTAVICNRSPLEGARYSPINFTPLVPLRSSYKRLSTYFWKMHSFSVWFRRVHSFSDNIGTASLLYIAKSESGSTLVESLFTSIIPL